jgi:predicted phage-related endonuclease
MFLDLSTLGLSAAAKSARLSCLGGSDANTIMSGDDERIINLWHEKRGDREPDDLSDNLAVIMGSFTEPLNAAWFEKQMGFKVDRRGEVAQHPERDFMRCTLDGTTNGAVWEAKHCGAFVKSEDVQVRYLPQLTHNMLCTGLESAFLSVLGVLPLRP